MIISVSPVSLFIPLPLFSPPSDVRRPWGFVFALSSLRLLVVHLALCLWAEEGRAFTYTLDTYPRCSELALLASSFPVDE